MLLSFVAQNLGHGGLRTAEGDPCDRWPALAERISAAIPDFVLLNEATDWDKYGHRQLARAMADLDMDALPLPPSPSGYRTALLYRRQTVGRWTGWNTDFADRTLHGFGVAAFDLGLPKPLAVAEVHLDPFDADRARAEAKLTATRALRYGPYAVTSGDYNFPPGYCGSPVPDYGQMRPYNLAARTVLADPDTDAEPVPDRRVGWMMRKCGFHDVAWEMYRRTGDEALLARTGHDDRIDVGWVSGPLKQAIAGYQLLDTPKGASDHHGIAFQIDTDRIDVTTPWDYR